MLSYIIITVILGISSCRGGIPSDVEVCGVADLECIIRTTTSLISRNPHGNKELGLVDLEPVRLKHIVVSDSSKARSAIQLNFKFNDLDIYGLSNTVVHKAVGFDKDPRSSKFEMVGVIPLLTLKGNYSAKGRVLLLPIVGEGKAEIQMINVTVAVKFKPNVTDKDGKQFIGINKIKSSVEPEDVKIMLENLFNGNKQLGEEMNRVINTNWRDVWTELQAGINSGFTEALRRLLTGVFEKITYDEFYKN